MASKQRLPDLLREREEEGRRQVVELRARTVRPIPLSLLCLRWALSDVWIARTLRLCPQPSQHVPHSSSVPTYCTTPPLPLVHHTTPPMPPTHPTVPIYSRTHQPTSHAHAHPSVRIGPSKTKCTAKAGATCTSSRRTPRTAPTSSPSPLRPLPHLFLFLPPHRHLHRCRRLRRKRVLQVED